MKRLFALLTVVILVVSLAGCGAKKAFTTSQDAFEKVNEAYSMVNVFSQDIYEAWRLGVNNSSRGCSFGTFASEMNIDQEYIEEAVANLSGSEAFDSSDWTLLYKSFNNSYFSAYVAVISEAYVCSGDVEEITDLLEDAKDLMKSLGDKHSDYEHYPALKTYFTNTLAFFDFCKNPEGSFEQVKETFNDYRNVARECFFELNYIFSDDIGGMKEAKDEEDE